MPQITFSIWLASKTRWAHLTKDISMSVVPRVGEWMKFENPTQGDSFAWRVTQVTYREAGWPAPRKVVRADRESSGR